jgi:hypothetical protein
MTDDNGFEEQRLRKLRGEAEDFLARLRVSYDQELACLTDVHERNIASDNGKSGAAFIRLLANCTNRMNECGLDAFRTAVNEWDDEDADEFIRLVCRYAMLGIVDVMEAGKRRREFDDQFGDSQEPDSGATEGSDG